MKDSYIKFFSFVCKLFFIEKWVRGEYLMKSSLCVDTMADEGQVNENLWNPMFSDFSDLE